MKYYVIIYQSLVKTLNGLNEKSSKNGSARNVLREENVPKKDIDTKGI